MYIFPFVSKICTSYFNFLSDHLRRIQRVTGVTIALLIIVQCNILIFMSWLFFLSWCLGNSSGPKCNYYNSVFSATCIPSVYETPPAALVLDAFKDGKISEVQRNILYDPLSAPLPSDPVTGVTLTPLQVSHILKLLFSKSQSVFLLKLNRWNTLKESKLNDVIWLKHWRLSKPQRQYTEREAKMPASF